MRFYIVIFTLVTAWLGYEYLALNVHPSWSVLVHLQQRGLIHSDVVLNTTPGKYLSYWLGWFGFGLMVLMNVYSLRKRIGFLHSAGRLSSWLNFHIFCGLMGPALILFHCGLKVRGLVGISFWSMVISLASGIIGKYALLQVAGQRTDFDLQADEALKKLERAFAKAGATIDETIRSSVLRRGLKIAGARIDDSIPNPLAAVVSSLIGDMRLAVGEVPVPAGWPRSSRPLVTRYAVNKRRAQSLESIQRLLSYWHAFHFPFAIFMYIAAVIHIVSSLIFQSPG